ncbi:MAG: HDOD domain-containing protein [Oceanococcus sp.]
MSGHTLPSEDHAVLSPSFGLIYRGLAPDAQRERILEILSKLLRLETDQVEIALNMPPLQLAHNPDRERVRKHQMGLANLGCIATVESFWKYRDWSINEGLKHTYEIDADQAPEQAFSLVRFHPLPGHALLQQAVVDCVTIPHVLNHTDILLQADARSGTELRHDIKRIKARLKEQPQCQIAIGLFPQDGDHLTDLLDCLNERIAANKSDSSAASSTESFKGEPWIAGQSWLELVKLGRNNNEGLTQQQSLECAAHWPSLMPIASASVTHSAQDICRGWTQAKSQRQSALDTLRIHCERLDQLPSLPTMVMRIHQAANDPSSSGEQLSSMVEQDPSLSARILALVNSSWFGLKARVESIEHALVVIGREELAQLALMISSEKVFRGLKGDAAKNLWRHSSHVGEIARELGRRCNHTHISTLFTAGLLHDVGKILLFSFEGTRMQIIQRKALQLGLPDYEMEREIWGYDHARLGALMLRRWGLPANLCKIVEQHHGPLPGSSEVSQDAAIIALADHIAHRLDASETHGDAARLRASQLKLLQASFGDLTLENADLLCEDLRHSLRGPEQSNAA